jgi:hypothetical protein
MYEKLVCIYILYIYYVNQYKLFGMKIKMKKKLCQAKNLISLFSIRHSSEVVFIYSKTYA